MSCGKSKCKRKCCCQPAKLNVADYVYAAVEGNIQLDSGETRFVNSPPTNPFSNPYNCVRGNLSGFDPVTGIFTAPRTALYQVSVWANYLQERVACPGPSGFIGPFPCRDCTGCTGINGIDGLCCKGPSGCVGAVVIPPLVGTTNTQICRELKENICGAPGTGFGGLDIAVVGQTAPWSFICLPGSTGTTECNYVASATLGASIPLRAGEKLMVSVFQENNQERRVFLFLEWMIVQGPFINLGKPRGPGVGT